jgi:hypothetical protein
MKSIPESKPYDAIILQNVYHYIYDKVGSHEEIFSHFAAHGRSIIWYNPMSADDPVIPLHAKRNPKTDWSRYSQKSIFEAAVKSGFLLPLPLKMRFAGMGPTREHWLFVRDDVRPMKPPSIPISEVQGLEIEPREHFKTVHQIRLSDNRSYKIFLRPNSNPMFRVQAAVEAGLYDNSICPDLQYIVDENGATVGYSQPRGIDLLVARGALGPRTEMPDFLRSVWVLLSRMVRFDMFNHDIGRHNFILTGDHVNPVMIDLENVLLNASAGLQLSIYNPKPTENEVSSAEANLGLLFSTKDVRIDGRDPISVLWDGLTRTDFLGKVDYSNVLRDHPQ